MLHKHGLRVQEVSLSLWVTTEDFVRNEDMYVRAGDIERVSRFIVAIYDEENHYSHTVSRYAMEHETEALRSALLSHVPDNLQNSDRFEMTLHPGFCIEKEKTPDLSKFVLGLSHV